MAANVMSLNYVRPGFAMLTPKPIETPKPVEVKVKTAPKTVRGWVAEATNALAHVMEECQDEALTHAILVAYTEALKLQKSIILKGVN